MKRYDEGYSGMLERVDGEWVLYVDHCEAMKRAALSAGEAQQDQRREDFMAGLSWMLANGDSSIADWNEAAETYAATPPRQMVADSALTVAVQALERLAEVPGCGCAYPCRCGGEEWTRMELEGRMDLAAEALAEIKRVGMVADSEQAVRPVTPLTCPKCHALWLFWPKEQTGDAQDSLNMRSAKSCDYCEPASASQLESLNRIDPVSVDTAPLYKALMESRLALLAVNSAASQRAISLIDAVLNTAPGMVADSAVGAEPIHQWRYFGNAAWLDASAEEIATRKASNLAEDMQFRIVYAAPAPVASPAALTNDDLRAIVDAVMSDGRNYSKQCLADVVAQRVRDRMLAAQPPAAAEAEIWEALGKLRKQIAAIPDRIEAISGQHFSYIKRAEVLATIDTAIDVADAAMSAGTAPEGEKA